MDRDHYSVFFGNSVRFYNEEDRRGGSDWLTRKFKHYGIFYRCCHALEAAGLEMRKDPYVERTYKTNAKNHWILYGPDGFKIRGHKFNNGFEFGVFCNGKNDLKEASYINRLRAKKYIRVITDMLDGLGIYCSTTPDPKYAEDWIKCRYAEDWFHEQKDTNFNLHDLDGQIQESSNALDRDRKQLHNGDLKYFRDWSGYLSRGRVYHNINNMYWVITDKYTVRNIADFELFEPTADDFKKRRMKKPNVPQAYKERKNALGGSKPKELIAELRRRGLKVSVKYG